MAKAKIINMEMDGWFGLGFSLRLAYFNVTSTFESAT